jgi:hypothetical protein
MADWLEGDNPFEEFDRVKQNSNDAKKESDKAALLMAQKYLVFESGVAKELLEFWLRSSRCRKIAPNAPAQELAYHNGVREFVESIPLQIQFAKNGGQSPYTER